MRRLALNTILTSKINIFIFSIFYLLIVTNQSAALDNSSIISSEKKQNIPVYTNDKEIGYLYEQVNDISLLEENKPFFILEKFNVFSKSVIIKSDVTITGTRNNNKPSYFFNRIYDVALENHNDYAIISVRNTIGVSYYQIYIRENKKNQLEIFKEKAEDSVLVKVKINDDDFDSQPADLICLRQTTKVINDIIYVPDSLNLNIKNKKMCQTKIRQQQ